MTETNYPSAIASHRRADLITHLIGFLLIVISGGFLIENVASGVHSSFTPAVVIYAACALVSNLASCAYHFSPWHDKRILLRRVDHAAIYLSISGTFTPFFIQAGTVWTLTTLALCWALTGFAVWHKITNAVVKTRWSTASYLGLGAIGLSATPQLNDVPITTLYCILAGAACYVIGTVFYVRKSMPYRYAIWHIWVNFGGIAMFAGVWLALAK